MQAETLGAQHGGVLVATFGINGASAMPSGSRPVRQSRLRVRTQQLIHADIPTR